MLRARPLVLAGVLLATSLPAQLSAIPPQEERQFDFWVGEWDVQNRALSKDGGWSDAGKSKARIRPILGGRAILEEWDGKTGKHQNTFGISVRYYNAATKRWVIILNWPNKERAGFSNMEGSFRHGRAEFFPPSAFDGKPPRATRFTFSDALPNSCRWDMASPVDGGGWRTSWIMEFSRTRSAAATIKDGEPIRKPPATCVCDTAEARQFDGLVGEWHGVGQIEGKRKVSVNLRATSTNRGCATLCFLKVDGVDYGEEHFEAWSYYKPAKVWLGRTLNAAKPEQKMFVGTFDDAGKAAMTQTDLNGNALAQAKVKRVRYEPVEKGWQVTHETSSDAGKTWEIRLQVELTPKGK